MTDLHPDWVGLLSWDAKSAKIDYLGPANSNPFKTVRVGGQPFGSGSPIAEKSTGTSDIHLVATTNPVNKFDSINQATGASGTAIYRLEQDFNLYASTTTGVNLYHWLDAKNSNKNSWLQVSAFYDKAGFFGSPAWHVGYDAYVTSSCGQYIGMPIQSAPIAFGTNNPATSSIRADTVTAGKYVMAVTDKLALIGTSLTFTIAGDTGKSINLGRTTGGGCIYPSGTQVEEETQVGAKYNFGTMVYKYGFYITSTSGKTTSATGFFGPEGCGANVSTVNSPAKATFTYTGTGC